MTLHNPFANDKLLAPDSFEFYFWLRHARRSEEPVVVLNAGTGRVAISLAQQYIRMIAVEADEKKRQGGIERSKAAKVGASAKGLGGCRIVWQAGEPANFTLAHKAGMVAMPDYGFQHLLTLDEQRAALRNIHKHLQIGGKLALVLDVPDVQAMATSQGATGGTLRPLEPMIDPTNGQTIYVWESSRYDLSEQSVSRHVVYEMVDELGVTVRRWHRTFKLAYLWPREVQLLLEGMGFDIEALYGGWNDEPFTCTRSTKQVWVVRKGI